MKNSSFLHHVAIIPDGNRRWAKNNNLPTLQGHRKGFETAIQVGKKIRSLGIHTMTIWAFSTENWSRSKTEVSYLMKLYSKLIDDYLEDAIKDEVRIIHLGRKDRLPSSLLKKLSIVEEKTSHHTKHILNIALDYGGQDEITRAIHNSATNTYRLSTLTEKKFLDLLDTAGQPYPNPDIVIRTSGEVRTSGFMMYQAAYAEYIFLKKHFPDITDQDIDDTVEEYQKRQRRFGR